MIFSIKLIFLYLYVLVYVKNALTFTSILICNVDTKNSGAEDLLWTPTRVHSPTLESIDDTSDNLFANIINECRKLPDSAETCDNIHLSANGSEVQQSSSDVNQSDAHKSSTLPQLCSNFPTSAQFFIDAIKKNRSYQKFIRSKLTQIEARLEENKKLKDRVKILKDFQVSCRKLTGRELSRKKDPRFKLISSHLSEVLFSYICSVVCFTSL